LLYKMFTVDLSGLCISGLRRPDDFVAEKKSLTVADAGGYSYSQFENLLLLGQQS